MERKFKSKPFFYRLTGPYALITDPATKGGGEKSTYQVITYQCLKGITEQIYWKPSLQIVIDEVKVINKIETESMGARPLTRTGNDLSYYTYLRDVEYLVKYHFEWNENRPDLKADWQEIKHQQIILRSLDRGGRRDIFIGTRECMGFVERLTEAEYENSTSYYHGQKLSFGIMFHSFTYPGEAVSDEGQSSLIANFTDIQMIDGRIEFIRPEECQFKQKINDYQLKQFTLDDMKSVDREIEEVDS